MLLFPCFTNKHDFKIVQQSKLAYYVHKSRRDFPIDGFQFSWFVYIHFFYFRLLRWVHCIANPLFFRMNCNTMCSFLLIWAGSFEQNVNKWCHQESIYPILMLILHQCSGVGSQMSISEQSRFWFILWQALRITQGCWPAFSSGFGMNKKGEG